MDQRLSHFKLNKNENPVYQNLWVAQEENDTSNALGKKGLKSTS
jgi:hypothetical protein